MAARIDLVVFDMEGTLTDNPTAWELMHLRAGTWESHGEPYWRQFRAGRMGYDEFARKDVATWKGSPVEWLEESVSRVPLMNGCAELLGLLRQRGIPCAIISNGLERLGLRLAREFGVARVEANRELVSDGRLTGGLELRVPYGAKAETMLRLTREMKVPPANVLAVGDGEADAAMFAAAGHSVAFLPENDRVAAAARRVVRRRDLRELTPLFNGR